MRKLILVAFTLVFLLSSAEARATQYPDEYAMRPLQLPGGMVELKVPVVMNLSRDSVASPVFIPFTIRLGMSDDLELRLFHPGRGLCVSGKSRSCDRVYNDLGFGFLYNFLREMGHELSVLGALEVPSFRDPALFRVDAGVAWKLVRFPLSIAVSPFVGIGLNHRDSNGDSLNVPAELAFQLLTSPLALFAESGLYGNLHDMADSWSMPLGVGLNYQLVHGTDLGAEFKLTDAIGNGSSTDGRLLIVYLAIHEPS